MLKNQRKIIIAFGLLLLVFGFSYYSFLKFKPPAAYQLKKNEEFDTLSDISIPYPTDSVDISTDKTSNTQISTFKTQKNNQDLHEFYETALSSRGWELESKGEESNSCTAKYKKEDKLITIISVEQQDQNETLVSIDLSDR